MIEDSTQPGDVFRIPEYVLDIILQLGKKIGKCENRSHIRMYLGGLLLMKEQYVMQ